MKISHSGGITCNSVLSAIGLYQYSWVLSIIFVLQRKVGAEFVVIQGCILHAVFSCKQMYRLNTLYLHWP